MILNIYLISIQSIDIKYIFNNIFNTSSISIYWFFPPLFCIYLSLPLFASVQKDKRNIVFLYLVVAGFILNSLIPFLISVFHLKLSFSYSIIVCNNYLLFVLIGYLLDKNELKKIYRYIIYGLGIIGLLLHIIGTYNLSMAAGDIVKTYKGYSNVPSILYSISIFVFLKELCKYIKDFRFINFLGKYTFAIYLMHFYIMDLFVNIFDVNTKNIIYRLSSPFLIVFICIICTYIIRKIPILKKIVP